MEDRIEAWIEATVEARVEQILLSKGSRVPQNPTPTAFSLQFRGRSSYGSTQLDEEETNMPSSVDGITKTRQCQVVHPSRMDKGQGGAWPGLACGRRNN